MNERVTRRTGGMTREQKNEDGNTGKMTYKEKPRKVTRNRNGKKKVEMRKKINKNQNQ